MVSSCSSNSHDTAFKKLVIVMFLSLIMGGCSVSMGNMFGGGDSEEEITGSTTQPPLTAPVGAVSGQPLPHVNGAPSSLNTPSNYQQPTVVTGSLPAQPRDTSLPVKISTSDWGYARGALGLALTGPENTPPVPWANPDTGVRGNFVPSAPAEVNNGVMCRSFIASRYEQSNSQKMQGKACRNADGYWAIEEAKPLL